MDFIVLGVTMTTVSPLYTGEVREEDKKAAKTTGVNFPVRKTATGRALVPFKGALRSVIETMLISKGDRVCDTGKSKARPCGQCVTCSMFGSMGRKGRLTTDFLSSAEDKRAIVRESTHARIDRQMGSISDSFKGEEVIEGAVFNAKIFINNPQANDVSLITSALAFIEENGVGGWTNKGYGRVKFSVTEEKLTKHKYLKG